MKTTNIKAHIEIVTGIIWALIFSSFFTLAGCTEKQIEVDDDKEDKEIVPVVPSGHEDLSATSTANCYIVSQSGSYCLLAATGNKKDLLLHGTTSASVLWESFGTSTVPNVGDLIKDVEYKDGYISFHTADTFKEGNAVIAAKDSTGTILWSWHIWLTDQPAGQVYFNDAGTMMDRNLGATSATPNDVGALGLLYQWGRKDPFLGSSSISSDNVAESTITWPPAIAADDVIGTPFLYTVAHPTTFITGNKWKSDWFGSNIDPQLITRWSESGKPKTIYDPCPAGWRVPDGGENGVWAKAINSRYTYTNHDYDTTDEGNNLSGHLGSDPIIWYPDSGYLSNNTGILKSVGSSGICWSASQMDEYSYYIVTDPRSISTDQWGYRADGFSVRCVQDSNEL